jgi:Protein of unknown function (DUF1275)
MASSSPSAKLPHNISNLSSSTAHHESTLVNSPFETPSSSESSTLSDGKEPERQNMTPSDDSPLNLKDYFSQEIDGAHTSIYLLVSFFTSGLIDSVAFNAWSCFVGMQTGTTDGLYPPRPLLILSLVR